MRRSVSVVLTLAALAAVAGCDRPTLPAKTEAAHAAADNPDRKTDPAALTPAQTVQRLHEHRLAGEYRRMLSLIVPDRRDAISKLVLSVDQLIAAEAHLQARIREVIGEGSATHFHQRDQVANILGPLSRDVEIIGESMPDRPTVRDGATAPKPTATVTIQTAGRLPLETVRLAMADTIWKMVPDKPIVGLDVEIQKLARVTRTVANELTTRSLTTEQIQKELALRQAPVLQRIAILIGEPNKTR